MSRLTIESPAVRRIAAEMGITVMTDQQGKDTADTSMGVVVESRYFVGDVLITRAVVPGKSGNGDFEWAIGDAVFTNPVAALRHADLLQRTGL